MGTTLPFRLIRGDVMFFGLRTRQAVVAVDTKREDVAAVTPNEAIFFLL